MTVFNESYSRYYDLLYRDKDYALEADFIDQCIRRHRPDAVDVIDLGCGTGKHTGLLAGKGYRLLGVDRSESMLAAARPSEIPGRLRFQQGDLCTLKLSDSFDAAVSLFHVMCYLDRNEDLQSAFRNVSGLLRPGGIFIFDCWYGPAVLTQTPTVRFKEMEDERIKVWRIASPALNINENTVDVHYYMLIQDKQSGKVEEAREIHRVRYLFKPEVEAMMKHAGLTIVEYFEFISRHTPGAETWNVCFIGRKQ